MRVIIEPDYETMSKWAANYVANKIIAANPTPDNPSSAIMAARADRSTAAQNEAQQRAREIEQAGKAPKQKAEPKQQKQKNLLFLINSITFLHFLNKINV